MQARDRIILELLAQNKCMAWVAKKLNIKRSIVGRVVKRLEKRGLVFVDRSEHPHLIKLVTVTPKEMESHFAEAPKAPTSAELKARAHALLGARCLNCNTNDARVLCIHHLNHDGHIERKKKSFNSINFYRAITRGKRTTDDLILLCYNCHYIDHLTHTRPKEAYPQCIIPNPFQRKADPLRDARGVTITPKKTVSPPAWALRNFAIKFKFTGNPPSTWRKFKKGWRGGPAYIKYAWATRLEVYMKKTPPHTLLIYAPRDMEGTHPRTLELDAIEWCKVRAERLSERLGWHIQDQYALQGAPVQIVRKGEFEARQLKQYARTMQKKGLTPIYHEHGKIDSSPKPAAFQIYGREWAERMWEAPAVIDKMFEKFELYNQNIVKHLSVLDEMSKTMKDIRDGLKKGKK